MINVYSVLVLGAGQIAAGYDMPSNKSILTHAHAVNAHDSFHLLGFYDVDEQKASFAVKKWGGRVYRQPDYADIIVICTPDNVHLESVRQAVALKPKLIVLEKPIAQDYSEARDIMNATVGIPVQVNFSRRFVREFQDMSKTIKKYGSFMSGSGLYGKGFIHNGSHMIDLLRLLLGDISKIEYIGETCDFFSHDKTKTVILHFDHGGQFFMQGIDCRHYTVFELDLCFENARIRILDGGKKVQLFECVASQEYGGYVNLSLRNEFCTEMDYAMLNLYQNIADNLSMGQDLFSSLEKSFTAELYKK